MKNKSIKKLFAVIILFAAGGFCFAADPAEGFWISVDEKTGKDTAGWEIYIRDGKLYGKILSVADAAQTIKADKCKDSYKGFPTPGKVSEMPVVGTIWIFGLVPDRQPGQWKDGNIIDPDNGSMYGCKIIFHPADNKKYKVDTLEMRGTIGPLGRSQFWRKATRAQAAGLR
ncbi:MAG: DUF2147 domain-containing protein [Spirochaetaceae bacterium]|jgi:uncharacterized protein (DUF2147 family)|nr:DUF2147 domain-containing protein [Spirochaetaceae bacterium]